MGMPKKRRAAVINIETLFKNHSNDLLCLNHDAEISLPKFIKNINFDLIILGPTFLYSRFNPKTFNRFQKEYHFISKKDTYKIAMPQDEYTYSDILDKWMCDWNISCVFSVLPKFKELIYPKYIKKGNVKKGFTMYINAESINEFKKKDLKNRNIDISYRASVLPESYGSIGQLKSDIGLSMSKLFDNIKTLNTDISINKNKILSGKNWYRFLEDSKTCIVTPSGSSIFDPKGEIRIAVERYKLKFPNSKFREVKENCFPTEDNKYIMTALSPRNIEAGLAGTVQICVGNNFSDILEPNIDYIPLKKDLSNIKEIIEILNNEKQLNLIAKNCRKKILSIKMLDQNYFQNYILDLVNNFQKTKKISNKETYLLKKYIDQYQIIEKKSWFIQSIKYYLRELIRFFIGERNYKKILLKIISKTYKI